MPSPVSLALVALPAILLAGIFQVYIQPLLAAWGFYRAATVNYNNDYCKTVPQLKACEKIILHPDSGLLYLACSIPSSRTHWTPAVGRLNESGASFNDYVATYDPKTAAITKLKVVGFKSTRGLSLHGMDVVHSSANPSELFVYLVNHRAPIGAKAADVGADSVIEIFKTTVGGKEMTHVKTVEDPIIATPNDVVGNPDGKSFYFTNDHGEYKAGHIRTYNLYSWAKETTVGYCDTDIGCIYAAQNMHANNGITRAPNGTVYVADSTSGGLSILEPQDDHTLVLTDIVPVDRALDNLFVDSEGHVWVAAFPDMHALLYKHFSNPAEAVSPTTVFRFSLNTGPDAVLGKKFKVEKMLEDDGKTISGTTSVVYDVKRNLLFMNGLASSHLTICKL
ncbi:calcium-dependent phosphotriesterase [Pholiota conissans]|uniref:Calcium-dependent phosphotriesterase n=1 Tax=Pholiota conissans TaxID=109636 RepID=A0A9P5ZA39_9AGAR|nr:calcium-dependent phosphotriesterase [Pholiota conissans]